MSLTDAGRDVVAAIDAVEDPAPEVVAALSDAELKQLHTILARISALSADQRAEVALQHRHRGVVAADP